MLIGKLGGEGFSKKKISKEIDEYKPLAENIKVP
jgi:hypothetical protein